MESSTSEETDLIFPAFSAWDFSQFKAELLDHADYSRCPTSPISDSRESGSTACDERTNSQESKRMEAKGFVNLPTELCIKIFGYLPVEAKLTAMRVCKKWNLNITERSVWEVFDLEGFIMTDPKRCLQSILERAHRYAHGALKHIVLPDSVLDSAIGWEFLKYLATSDARAKRRPFWEEIAPKLKSFTFGLQTSDFQDEFYLLFSEMTSLEELHILSPASHDFLGSSDYHRPLRTFVPSLRKLSMYACRGILTHERWPWRGTIEDLEYYGAGDYICIENIGIFAPTLKFLKITDCVIHSKTTLDYNPLFHGRITKLQVIRSLAHFASLRSLTFVNCEIHVGLDLPASLRTFTVVNSCYSGRIAAVDRTFEAHWGRHITASRVWKRCEKVDGTSPGDWEEIG